jgi:hypothetical protein
LHDIFRVGHVSNDSLRQAESHPRVPLGKLGEGLLVTRHDARHQRPIPVVTRRSDGSGVQRVFLRRTACR